MTFQYQVSHSMLFSANRDDTWPESMPWPEWKPNTEKKYRPQLMTFTIHWTDDGPKPSVPVFITITGPRILQSGKMGSEVACTYYYDTELPRVLQELIHAGLRAAWEHRGTEQPVAPAVPGTVP